MKIIFIILFTIISSTSIEAQTVVDIDEVIFHKVEIEAEFPGGLIAWNNYVTQNLNLDIPIKRKAPAGTYKVIVRFIVNQKGERSDITAETRFGYGIEEEAVRIIKDAPNWTPAIQNGHIVKAYRRELITFIISKE